MGQQEERHSDKDVYNSLYVGFVVDRNDPKGLGRVTVRIPGLLEPASTFAFPLGMSGGGAKQRGRFQPPEVDAAVGVLFYMGDINRPYYMYGHWAEGEAPTGAAVDGDDAGNYPTETKQWLIEIDDRAPNILRLTHKTTGDKIELNGTTRNLKATIKDSSFEVDGDGDKAKLTSKTAEVEVDGGADKVIITGGEILLGPSATEKLVKGTAFKAFLDAFISSTFNAHTHFVAAAPGTSATPLPTGTLMPASNLSDVSKTE